MGTVAEQEYEAFASTGTDDPRGDPDVLLDVPVLKVDSIHLQVEDLDARVSLRAKVLDLVNLTAGVDVHLGKLRIDVKGVEAQALLKVRLDRVAAIVDRVLTTVDRNPELIKSIGRTAEEIGQGAGHALGETGEAVEEVGEGAGEAVEEVGSGAGQAVGDVGEGAGQAVGGLLGGDGGGAAGVSAGQVAKLAAKMVAQEVRSAAADEAKELGLAAARKAKRAGERRKERKAEEKHATEAALRTADELHVDLEEIEGTGPEGRITIRDVRHARGIEGK